MYCAPDPHYLSKLYSIAAIMADRVKMSMMFTIMRKLMPVYSFDCLN